MSSRRDLTPREARDRFLARRQSENTDNTLRSYSNRLTRFVEWADEADVETMGELDGWLLDEYKAYRETKEVAPSTVKGQMTALVQLLKYCESVDVVEKDLHEKVIIPKLSKVALLKPVTTMCAGAAKMVMAIPMSRSLASAPTM